MIISATISVTIARGGVTIQTDFEFSIPTVRGRQERLTKMMQSVFSVQPWYTSEKQPVSAVN